MEHMLKTPDFREENGNGIVKDSTGWLCIDGAAHSNSFSTGQSLLASLVCSRFVQRNRELMALNL